MNCFGVKSCGRLPFENALNASNRWGPECMDFGDAKAMSWLDGAQATSELPAA